MEAGTRHDSMTVAASQCVNVPKAHVLCPMQPVRARMTQVTARCGVGLVSKRLPRREVLVK
jgi:hypothetical protein